MDKLIMENATIIRAMRNFAGRASQFNDEGKRNFGVLLPRAQYDLEKLAADGWNVKFFRPRDDEEEPDAFLKVNVKYGVRPPEIVMVTDEGRIQTQLNEDTVETLDYADISSADLIINPYEWSTRGQSGVTAYLEKAWFTIEEDYLTRKYRQLREGDHGWEN